MLIVNSSKKKRKKKTGSHTKEFDELLRNVDELAKHKLGYPVSLLTFLGILDNQPLGIHPGTLANVLLNNVGDPFVDSQTSLMEVKKHERKLIRILEKYYGLKKDEARGYVTTGGTEGNFAAMWWSKRYLINKKIDDIIAIDHNIKLQIKEEQHLTIALTKIPFTAYQERALLLQKIIDLKSSIQQNKDIMQQLLTPTIFFSKEATHYSVPKISEILRLNIRTILSNADGAINLENLKKELILHKGAHPHSAVIILANIGTTITGAIDDVPSIKKILDETTGVDEFTIHMDGALTGFVMPILKPFGEIPNYFDALGANTLVFSAHKYPGLSQPCGIVLAKRDFFEKAFEKSERNIDYVGNIRDVTITGSRSGLNVLMFYHALRTLAVNEKDSKLKGMVAENMATAKYLYDELVKIDGEENVAYPNHFNVTFPKPSIDIAKKYQLMLTGDKATICVLSNVTKQLIDRFIVDLKNDRRKTMPTSTNHDDIQFEMLSEKHLDPVVRLFVKSFCDSEPITKPLQIPHHHYTPFATEVTQKAIHDKLSMVVLKENVVIGFILAEDMANPFIPNLSSYPKLKPIYALLEELSKTFITGRTFKKGKILHTWIAAIDPAFRTKGIYKALGLAHVMAATKKNFDYIYSDFTNEQSEKIIHQLDIVKLCNKIKLSDFIYQSTRPFAMLTGYASSYITPINKNVTLDSMEHCYTLSNAL